MSSSSLPLRSRLAKYAQKLPGGSWAVQLGRLLWGEGQPHEQWQRIVLNRQAKQLIDSLHPEKLKTLEISGWNWPREGYFKEHHVRNYPDFDICKSTLSETFDLIIAEQVFEHLLWPYQAARHVYQMLNPGGYFFIATPFLIKIHECPYDCTRWTETGLKHFLAEAGFPLPGIRTFSWGNRACVKGNLIRWQIYQPGLHSLKNDPEYPIQVWALAQRPT